MTLAWPDPLSLIADVVAMRARDRREVPFF
jgi:hypothetical protein